MAYAETTKVAAERSRFLRIPDVIRETGLSRTTIYRLERRGDFPPRVTLSPNSMGWWSNEIDGWKLGRARKGSS